VVSKSVQGEVSAGLPSSHIAMVTGEWRVREIARMLGGEALSNAAFNHAKEMLGIQLEQSA
jgi:DNA repair ATPase RecN